MQTTEAIFYYIILVPKLWVESSAGTYKQVAYSFLFLPGENTSHKAAPLIIVNYYSNESISTTYVDMTLVTQMFSRDYKMKIQ